MKIMKKMYVFFLNFRKKRFIYKELQKKNKDFNGDTIRNKEKIRILTESIFRSAKIVENDIFQSKDSEEKYNDDKLFNDLKNVISKHYSDKETELVKKIKILEADIQRKNTENTKLKNEISKAIKR